jgi:hypothetical protein
VTRWLSAILVLLALLVPAAARADGDPASDYLLSQPLFTPYDVKLPPASVEQLTTILRDAKAKGYEVRVALIATRNDLGSVPSLFGKPQAYAQFLHQEIRFVYKGPLLIVMPNGYGYYEQGKHNSLVSWPKPSTQPDLARAAVPVVQLLAKMHGVQVAIPPLRGTGGHGTREDRILIAVGAVLLAALALGVLALRRRRPV